MFCLASLLSPFCSHSLSLSLCSGSHRPSFRRGPVRPLAWLLAKFCAVSWRCACLARCQHGSTMRCATMSCVCSTRGTHHALNLHLHLASPGPQLLSLAEFTLPEHSLLSHSSSCASCALLSSYATCTRASSRASCSLFSSSSRASSALLSSSRTSCALLSSRASSALLSSSRASCALLSSLPHAPHALSPHPQDLAVSHLFSSLPLSALLSAPLSPHALSSLSPHSLHTSSSPLSSFLLALLLVFLALLVLLVLLAPRSPRPTPPLVHTPLTSG